MFNGAAGKGYMRLRSGKNGVPEGNVLPRLHKCVPAVSVQSAQGRKLRMAAGAPSHFSDPNPPRPRFSLGFCQQLRQLGDVGRDWSNTLAQKEKALGTTWGTLPRAALGVCAWSRAVKNHALEKLSAG